MADDSTNYGSFALGLQSAYHEVHMHSPQGLPEVAERLRGRLDALGITLTTDILRALAYAIVNGRDL